MHAASGFRNWVPEIVNCKTFGHPTFQRSMQYTQITTINMHLIIEIRHNILLQSQGKCIEMKKFN